MNFFKNLFGSKKTVKADIKAIESLVKPLAKHATSITLSDPKRAPENSQMLSHFGGQPYFEKGESWPLNQNGRALEFVFQVFNDSYDGIPGNIKLIQFFYDFEEFAWESESDGWKVKIYEELDPAMVIRIEDPTDKPVKYCEITMKKSLSFPGNDDLHDLYPDVADQITKLSGDDEDYEVYEEICIKLIGEEPITLSMLGGYPAWIQGNEHFKDTVGMPMDLLFQIDSEDNANIMWGDTGILYVFFNTTTKDIKFVLQCY